MHKIIFIAILLSISHLSCLPVSKKKGINGLWYYVFNRDTPTEDATPEGFLYLQSDSSYTRDFNAFDYGNWSIKGSELLLTNNQQKTISFPIKHISTNELQLLSAKGIVLRFERQFGNFTSVATNPFSVENNQWRIPPTQKETDAEIKNRLKNHFRFHVVYFKWALDAGLSSIDVRNTPSPIKIYRNGFTLKKFDDLPDAWRTYFYDKEDCQKANEMIKTIFTNDKIIWEKTDNRYKMFISAFQQLEEKIAN